MCSVTNISATLTPIGMKVCVTADLSFGHKVSPFSGDNFRGDQMRDQKRKRGSFFKQSYLTSSILQTVSRKVTCKLELNISSTRAFCKCKPRDSPRGVQYKHFFEHFCNIVCDKRETIDLNLYGWPLVAVTRKSSRKRNIARVHWNGNVIGLVIVIVTQILRVNKPAALVRWRPISRIDVCNLSSTSAHEPHTVVMWCRDTLVPTNVPSVGTSWYLAMEKRWQRTGESHK